MNPRRYRVSWSISTALLLAAGTGMCPAADLGTDANPTGQPIGGGEGYTAGPRVDEATRQVQSLVDLQAALAAAQPGDVVWVQRAAVIDLADSQLVVPAKVTLAGDRGTAGSPGPLLTCGMSGLEWRLQLQRGARLTGLRLQGPNPPLRDIDRLKPNPSGYAVACVDAEVDNCQISCFQRGGIAHFRDSERGHVHHNHLHDIAAYPILVANGSGDGHVFEANRIEWAWHAVASNGSRGSGYTARYNLFVRVRRPALFDASGPDPPNWCLDVHAHSGEQTRPPREPVRRLVVHHNTFTAAADVPVGDGSELLTSINAYPKHDIFVGAANGLTTTVEIHHNRFLMHERAGSSNTFKPYGRAVRLVGFKGDAATLPDDPAPAVNAWNVTIHDNRYGGMR